ncbi:uncharacterized protein DS421_1g32310 [Arachis hypogaea]|nr:uncharacterized protein DS421_1g32310 [Arachis hypogaea]
MNQWRLRGKVITVGEAKFRRQLQTKERPVQVDRRGQYVRGAEDYHRGKDVRTDTIVDGHPVTDQTEIKQGNGGMKRIDVAIVEENMDWLVRSLVGKTLQPLDLHSLKDTVRKNLPHIVDV